MTHKTYKSIEKARP